MIEHEEVLSQTISSHSVVIASDSHLIRIYPSTLPKTHTKTADTTPCFIIQLLASPCGMNAEKDAEGAGESTSQEQPWRVTRVLLVLHLLHLLHLLPEQTCQN